MDAENSLFLNTAYTLCGRKEKRGNGYVSIYAAYQHNETDETVIEVAVYRFGKFDLEMMDFSQSEPLNAEQANQLWKMYTI